jgi:hypothetical protein
MALEVAWSWAKGATGDWSASCPVGPYRLVVRTWTWGDWLRRWSWRRVRFRLGSTLTAIGVCQERFGGGQVASAAGYLAHVPRGR